MLEWAWLDDDTCVFYCYGEEIYRCNDEDFDRVLERLLLDFS